MYRPNMFCQHSIFSEVKSEDDRYPFIPIKIPIPSDDIYQEEQISSRRPRSNVSLS